jgi:hypothetical protein
MLFLSCSSILKFTIRANIVIATVIIFWPRINIWAKLPPNLNLCRSISIPLRSYGALKKMLTLTWFLVYDRGRGAIAFIF